MAVQWLAVQWLGCAVAWLCSGLAVQWLAVQGLGCVVVGCAVVGCAVAGFGSFTDVGVGQVIEFMAAEIKAQAHQATELPPHPVALFSLPFAQTLLTIDETGLICGMHVA